MQAKEILKNQISEKKTTSSYIFFGSDLQLSCQIAKSFAVDLEISEFDIIEIEPEAKEKNSKGEIKIVQVRELIRQINLTPGQGKRKLAIIKDADRLSISAANTLLKTLEEPPASSLIILLSRDLKLIPTITSRCQIVRFTDKTESTEEGIVKDLLSAEQVSLKRAFAIVGNLSLNDNVENYLEKALKLLRTDLTNSPTEKILTKIKAVLEAKKNLSITTNKKLVLENLVLKMSDD